MAVLLAAAVLLSLAQSKTRFTDTVRDATGLNAAEATVRPQARARADGAAGQTNSMWIKDADAMSDCWVRFFSRNETLHEAEPFL